MLSLLKRLAVLVVLAAVLPASSLHAATYYYHNDHLGTPLALTDQSQQIVWRGVSEPFGEVDVSANAVEQNIRFPGQYYDSETGLHYNYFRSYDSSIGRYTQSDPIGLLGGINTYSYAHSNPNIYTDPTGEFVPQLVGFAFGAAFEYFTNECASATDILLAGAIGAVGGGLGKAALLKYGPKSLTREHGKEWSHSVARKQVNKHTTGKLNKALNKRGGLNGSWTSPKRHYKHDATRFPKGHKDFGPKLPKVARAADRIPDWGKASVASGAAGAGIAGKECEDSC